MPLIKRLARAARHNARRLTQTPGARKLQREAARILVAGVAVTMAGLYLVDLGIHRVASLINQEGGRKS